MLFCKIKKIMRKSWNQNHQSYALWVEWIVTFLSVSILPLKIQIPYQVGIFSAATSDSAGAPEKHWCADAALLGPHVKVHSLHGSPPALDTPIEDTKTTGWTVLTPAMQWEDLLATTHLKHDISQSRNHCFNLNWLQSLWPVLWAQPSHLLVVWPWRQEPLAENTRERLTSSQETEQLLMIYYLVIYLLIIPPIRLSSLCVLTVQLCQACRAWTVYNTTHPTVILWFIYTKQHLQLCCHLMNDWIITFNQVYQN